MNNFSNLKKRYDKYGTVMFDLSNSFFIQDDFIKLEELISKLPYEYVSTGDAGKIIVEGSLMTDIKNPKV